MFWRPRGMEDNPRFGRYYVVKLIHEGEKSTVYVGEAMPGEPEVAIKLYKKQYDRFARQMEKHYGIPSEGEVGMSLNPRAADDEANFPIVKTLEYGTEYNRRRGPRYIVMNYVAGYNLKNLITCEHELVRTFRPRLILQLARALKIIHDRGFVYRDFCPDNVILSPKGNVKLIDAGFAAPFGVEFKEKTGTPAYMSPEQITCGRIEAASDIYSFGIFLYELIAGRPPFTSTISGDSPKQLNARYKEIMDQQLYSKVPPLTGNLRSEAGHLFGVIERCLQKDPADRYQTVQELLDALL